MNKMQREIDVSAEREFENAKASGEISREKQDKFYIASRHEIADYDSAVYSLVTGKKVLEIGCSTGEVTQLIAENASEFVGVDISDVAIRQAQERFGALNHVSFRLADVHSLPFVDGEFDVVIANSILHHLDLEQAVPEVHRVLRSEGRLACREPISGNPAFALYRLLTPTARTEDERPLTKSDLMILERYFNLRDVRWFGCFSLLTALGVPESWSSHLRALDRLVGRSRLRRLCWQMAGVAQKKT